MTIDRCRLCAATVAQFVAVYGEHGLRINLEHKIRTCSPVQVKPSDTLPHKVCLCCLSQLDTTYDFYQKVKAAQLILKAGEEEPTKKRRLSESKEECSRKKFHFGTTTLSNLTKSFNALHEKGHSGTSLSKVRKPLTVDENSDSNSVAAQGGVIPNKAQAVMAEKNHAMSPLKGLVSSHPTQALPEKARPITGPTITTSVTEPTVTTPVTDPTVTIPSVTEPCVTLPTVVTPVKVEQHSRLRLRPKPEPKSPVKSSDDQFKSCIYCDRKFLLEDLLQHEALHKGAISFACSKCSKSFFNEAAYLRHLARHTSGKAMHEDA